MSGQTATSWFVYPNPSPEGRPGIDGPEGTIVLFNDVENGSDDAGIHGETLEQARELANFIVRAVNNHAVLLAALKEVTTTLAYLKGEDWETIKNARTIIAAAESSAP